MSNQFDMKCPKCGSADEIDIAATVWVRLVNDGTDADESNDGCHEWGDNSPATCGACNFNGKVSDFEEAEEGGAP